MMLKSAVFALLIVAVPCLASLGPPPGSRGTIDFRYPDYIVEPRPHCPSVGVFPHPRNCTWYYWCQDPFQVGFYQQDYFECEPGTVFSDALDQCIHPFNPDYPCDPGSNTPAPPPRPTPAPVVPDCFDSMIRCKVYLCPNANGAMGSVGRLCQNAYSMCQNGSQISYCSQFQYFDVLTRTCVTPPGDRNCVDEEVFDSTASPPPTTTTTTTTTTTPAPNPDDCYESMVECKYYQCPRTGEKEYLCKKAFQACNFNKLTFYCDSLHYFHYGTRECVDPPSSRGCVEVVKTTTPAPTTTPAIDPSLLTFSFTVECSVDNPRPKEPKLAEYYCSKYATCLRGQNSLVELCDKYLQCVRTKNEWQAIVMQCPPDLYFSYDNDICITKPDGLCKSPNLI